MKAMEMHSKYENKQNKIDRKMDSHVVHSIKVYFQEKCVWCVCVCARRLDLYASWWK
jgi:hypothetical protein